MLAAFQPPRELQQTPAASAREGVSPGAVRPEHAIPPLRASAAGSRVSPSPSGKPDAEGISAVLRCGLSAENLSRSPTLSDLSAAVPPFREEPSAGNAARRSVAPLLPAVLKTALCYRSISSESVHSRFSASLPVRRVHAGRGGRHKDRGEMIRIFVRRKLPYPLNVSVSDSPATAPPFGTVRTDGECRQHDLDPAQDFLPAPCFLFLSDSAAVRA